MTGLFSLLSPSEDRDKHHTKTAGEDPPYLHAGELLEFNLPNEKAQREKRKKDRNRLESLKKTAMKGDDD